MGKYGHKDYLKCNIILQLKNGPEKLRDTMVWNR